MEDQISIRWSSRHGWDWKAGVWSFLFVVWFVVMCLVPDPRPLAAPEAAVRVIQRLTGVSDPSARAAATIALRAAGLGLIGVFASLWLSSFLGLRAGFCGLLIGPVLAVASMWINFGYFPISQQLQLAVVCSLAGALLAMAVQRSKIALTALIGFGVALFVLGTSTRVPNDLDAAARQTGLHLLERADEIPSGDEGFTEMLRIAFAYAEDNSHGRDAIGPNRAAILALGVILGEERVAAVARRDVNRQWLNDFGSLRNRVTLRGRSDFPRHFCVSSALRVLSDKNRAMAVGLTKELMDSQSGGSGFSFTDKAANMAGIRFAELATASPESAREMQQRILDGMSSSDFCPDVSDLPEGLTRDEFHAEFGGLGGAATREVFAEIERRLSGCAGLAPAG